MKIRIKFKKEGVMKFIGHLDVMRYFQKLLRRASIPIAYSSGMSPHQIMSFAMPLGTGIESDAEYVDIEITDYISSEAAIRAMNNNNVEGIEIVSFKELPENAKNAMASIYAAKYYVTFRDKYKPDFKLDEALLKLMNKDTIEIIKKTKKGETAVDIKPGIYEYSCDKDSLTVTLATGSALNIKPEYVIEALLKEYGLIYTDNSLLIRRLEIYTNINDSLVSLDDIGHCI